MFRRVGLIVLGIVIYGALHEFGVPRRLALIIAFVPFGLAEAKNLTGPYEKSAHEIMHESEPDTAKVAADPETGPR